MFSLARSRLRWEMEAPLLRWATAEGVNRSPGVRDPANLEACMFFQELLIIYIYIYKYKESIFYGWPQNSYSVASPPGMLGLATSPSVPSSRSILGASLPSEPSIQERRSRLHNKRLDSGSRSSLRNQSSKTLEPIRFQPDICNYGSFKACYDNAWTSIFIIGK